MSRFLTAAILALLLVSPAHALLGLFSSHTEVTPVGEALSIPLAEVADGNAHFYRVNDKGVEVKFFVIRTADGLVRTAFDACDVCFHAKKGYTQDKEFMVCNNCGMKFHATRIGDVHGGCNPSPLKSVVSGDKLTIAMNDVRQGVRFFQ